MKDWCVLIKSRYVFDGFDLNSFHGTGRMKYDILIN